MTDLTLPTGTEVVAPTWRSETKSGNAFKRVLKNINTPGVKLLRTVLAAGNDKSAATFWFLLIVTAFLFFPLIMLDLIILAGHILVAGLLALAYSNEKSRTAGPFVAKYGFVFPIVVPTIILTFLLTMIFVPTKTITSIKTVTNTITLQGSSSTTPPTSGEEGGVEGN